ncbi:MAG: hypothetical protein K2W82_09665 [Candidatus Obscuribacterales bacterium]|nr:hypothetical protein [Candidatus Obscuribacterales bacterium]
MKHVILAGIVAIGFSVNSSMIAMAGEVHTETKATTQTGTEASSVTVETRGVPVPQPSRSAAVSVQSTQRTETLKEVRPEVKTYTESTTIKAR